MSSRRSCTAQEKRLSRSHWLGCAAATCIHMRGGKWAWTRARRWVTSSQDVLFRFAGTVLDINTLAACPDIKVLLTRSVVWIYQGIARYHCTYVSLFLVPKVSKGVKGLSKGQRVVSAFTVSCNKCWFCMQRLTCRCSHPDWGARVFGCVPGQMPCDSTAAHPAPSLQIWSLAQACTLCIAP